MGSKKVVQTSTPVTNDARIGVGADTISAPMVNLSGAGTAIIETTDDETINRAFDFLQSTGAGILDSVDPFLSLAENVLDFAGETRTESFRAGQDAVSSAFNAVSELTTDVKNPPLDESPLTAALIAAGIIGAVALVAR